jgi:hypothetical protein
MVEGLSLVFLILFSKETRMKHLRLLALAALVAPIGLLADETVPTAAPQPETNNKARAAWTIVDYMQADNNLSDFATENITDMQQALLPNGVNMLVQWDKPEDNMTWRYRVTHNGRIDPKSLSAEGKALIDAGSLTVEMGINPEKELVDCMKWASSSFPANQYALILWNHGSGIEDPRAKLHKQFGKCGLPFAPWLQIPGYPAKEVANQRGILFDDSQNTYLTNQGLTRALACIKTVLGKNLDLLGMDACLMAMIEVGYQVKDSVNILVGSQNVEAGQGWSYSDLLSVFDKNPAAVTPELFATAIVNTYHSYYTTQEPDGSHTQAAMQLSNLNDIGANINQLVAALVNCKKINATRTLTAVRDAYRAAIKFDMPEYIDLYSFYAGLSTRVGKDVGGHPKANAAYDQATAQVQQIATAGMKLVLNAVIANGVGSDFAEAKGISIYLPANAAIHDSYPLTLFARNTSWLTFLKTFKVS